MDSRTAKLLTLKGLRLEKLFIAAKERGRLDPIRTKFTSVWGQTMADHFLSKYSDAESLIWALDGENMEKFVRHF